MAKDYAKGLEYNLFFNTATTGTPPQPDYGNPTWVRVPAASEIDHDPDVADVEVPERQISTGHLAGKPNHKFNFTLMEDLGDARVASMIAAVATGDDSTRFHLAIARAAAIVADVTYRHMECKLMGTFSADQAEVAQWEIEATRHANSANEFKIETVPAGP